MSGQAGLALSWSGGKDSALALWALEEERLMPAALLATVTAEYDRVSMHGVRRSLLRRQAAATGLPLVEIDIPACCTNDLYESRMVAAFASTELSAVEEVAFGDFTTANVGKYLAITLDKRVLSSPVIQTAIVGGNEVAESVEVHLLSVVEFASGEKLVHDFLRFLKLLVGLD